MSIKFKYHKIRGIEKSVCTAEQMIAYNVAHNYTYKYRETWKKTKDNHDRLVQKDFIFEAINLCMKMIMDNETICKKYNIDAIQAALNAGMENYWNSKYSIFTNYEDVGKMFPAYYL